MSKRIRKPQPSSTNTTNQSLDKQNRIVISQKVNQLLEEMANKSGVSKGMVLEKLVQDSSTIVLRKDDINEEGNPVPENPSNSPISEDIYKSLQQQTTEQIALIEELKKTLLSKDDVINSLNNQIDSQKLTVTQLQEKESQLNQVVKDLEQQLQQTKQLELIQQQLTENIYKYQQQIAHLQQESQQSQKLINNLQQNVSEHKTLAMIGESYLNKWKKNNR